MATSIGKVFHHERGQTSRRGWKERLLGTPELPLGQKPERYLMAFVLGFGIALILLLPFLFYYQGMMMYYGDFNSQQLPFYQMMHDSVRAGDLLWNWKTDLGASAIGSYSFYLLGSPFFWLTIPFPSGAVMYLIPWLLMLKFALASLTAYAYLRKFVRSPDAALIGALLYAFSGFQAYNLFFNHFHDVTAFFPLLLLAMEEKLQNNRKGVFAIMVALMAVINYFFFFGEVVFCVLYFVVRWMSGAWEMNWKKFFGLAFEAVAGVLMSCFLLLPSALYILGNPRTSSRLMGQDLFVYSSTTRIPWIIQNFFQIPDLPAFPTLFKEGVKWSSIAGYLPLFSMAGVIAFLAKKKGHWASRLIWISILMAFVPVLNSAFSAFTASYYARWYYMPILIMAMMTAQVVDDRELEPKNGIYACFGVVIFFMLLACAPTKNDSGETVFFALPQNSIYYWISFYTAIGLLLAVFILFYYIGRDRKSFQKIAVIFTAAGCVVSAGAEIWMGLSNGPEKNQYIEEAIRGKEKISLPQEPEGQEFYRVDISKNKDNYPMFWGLSNMRAFQSTVPSSILEFYPTVGVTRDVASRADPSVFGLRGLFSVKYYFYYKPDADAAAKKAGDESGEPPILEMPGFSYYDTQNNFYVYQNDAFVPMGFTYGQYMTRETYDAQNKDTVNRLLMRAMVLTNEQIKKYQGQVAMEPILSDGLNHKSQEQYLKDCEERAKTSCYEFIPSTRGFTAKINLPKENLVFFSVPYDEGFTAYVDGQEAEVEKVNVGFMAVKVPAGDHSIEFRYMPAGFKKGAVLSLAGLVLLGGYLWLFRKRKAQRVPADYGYESWEPPVEVQEEASAPGQDHPAADSTEK